MKFRTVLLFCLSLGAATATVACVTESTGTDDGSGGLNPQPLPPVTPPEGNDQKSANGGAADEPGPTSPPPNSSSSSSSSSGAPAGDPGSDADAH